MALPFTEFLGLVTGSGVLGAGVSFIASRKNQKQDLSQKTIDFWEGKADNYLNRLEALEARTEILEELKCNNKDCENRS